MPEARIIAAAQCRAARALLEWTDVQLAEAAKALAQPKLKDTPA